MKTPPPRISCCKKSRRAKRLKLPHPDRSTDRSQAKHGGSDRQDCVQRARTIDRHHRGGCRTRSRGGRRPLNGSWSGSSSAGSGGSGCSSHRRGCRRGRHCATAGASGRQGWQLDSRRRRRLRRQINSYRFLLRLNFAGFFFGRHRAGRSARYVFCHKN